MGVRRLALAAAVALAACGGAPAVTVLKVQSDVKDATVTIDDVYVGAAAWVGVRGVHVPEGRHRVTVEKVGYFPFDTTVDAKSGGSVVEVKLVKIPD